MSDFQTLLTEVSGGAATIRLNRPERRNAFSLPAAQEFARDIAASTSAVSVAATKALVYRALEEPGRGAAHRREHEVFRWMGRQADAAEGVTSFLEKRQPRWQLSKTKDLPPQLSGGSRPAPGGNSGHRTGGAD